MIFLNHFCKKFIFRRFFPFGTLVLIASVNADETAPRMEEMFITASRFEQPIADVIGSIEYFGEKDIDQIQPTDLTDLLSLSNGVQVGRVGGRGSKAAVGLRGAREAQTLQLINGHRYGSATAGGSRLELLPPEFISSLEVLRGTGSSLYGSDAIGGVINTIPLGLMQTETGLEVGTAYGSDGYYRNYLLTTQQIAAKELATKPVTKDTASKKTSVASLTLGLRREVSDGYDITPISGCPESNTINGACINRPLDADDDEDGFNKKGGLFAVHLKPTENSELGMLMLRSKWNVDIDDPYTDFGTESLFNELELRTNQLFGQTKINEYYFTRISVSESHDSSKAIGGFYPGYFITDTTNIDWSNRFEFSGVNLIVGSNKESARVTSSQAYANTEGEPKRKIYLDSVYIQLSSNTDFIGYSFGMRNDHHSEYGSKLTNSFAVNGDISQSFNMYWQFSQGFRAPTFNDLFYDSPWFVGNPELSPEESNTMEAGIEADYQMLSLRVSAFKTEYSDLITSIGGSLTNIDMARFQGVETFLTLSDKWLGELNIGIDFLSAHDESAKTKIDRVPYRAIFASWLKSWKRLSVAVLSQGRDKTQSFSGSVNGFGLVDAVVDWQASPLLSVNIKATNIFDRKYQFDALYLEQRFGIIAGATFKF